MGIATYVVLNILFVAVAVVFSWPWLRHNRKRFIVVALHLLVLTAIFDTIAIHYGVFAYDAARLLGLRILEAPLEDFAYPIAAALVIPRLWQLFKQRKDQDASDD